MAGEAGGERGGGGEEDLHGVVARSLSPRPPSLNFGSTLATPTTQLSFTNKAIPEWRSKGTSTSAVALLKDVQEEDEETLSDSMRWPRRSKPPSPGVVSGQSRDRYYHRMGIINTHSPAESPRLELHHSGAGGNLEEEEEEGEGEEEDEGDREHDRSAPGWQSANSASKPHPFPPLGRTRANREAVHDGPGLTDGAGAQHTKCGNGFPADEQPPSHCGFEGEHGIGGSLSKAPAHSLRPRPTGASDLYGQRPSPPIGLQQETHTRNSASASSPDSGYGNTPENGSGSRNRIEEEGEGGLVRQLPTEVGDPGVRQQAEGSNGASFPQTSAWHQRDREASLPQPPSSSSVLPSGEANRQVKGIASPTHLCKNEGLDSVPGMPLSFPGHAHPHLRLGEIWGEDGANKMETPVEFGFRQRSSGFSGLSRLSDSSPNLCTHQDLVSRGNDTEQQQNGCAAAIVDKRAMKDMFSHVRDEEGCTAASSLHVSRPLRHTATPTTTARLREEPATPTPPPAGSSKSHTLPSSPPPLSEGEEVGRGGGGGGERRGQFRARKGNVGHQQKMDGLAHRRRRSHSQPVISPGEPLSSLSLPPLLYPSLPPLPSPSLPFPLPPSPSLSLPFLLFLPPPPPPPPSFY